MDSKKPEGYTNPPPQSTIYDMEKIIKRCFEEAREAGYLKPILSSDDSLAERDVIVNEIELAKHISMTLIGELVEFELIRRISPIFRAVEGIRTQFSYLDGRQAMEADVQNLRIGKK